MTLMQFEEVQEETDTGSSIFCLLRAGACFPHNQKLK